MQLAASTSLTPTQKSNLVFLAKAALSMALVAVVARQLDFNALAVQLRNVHLGWLALGAALVVVQTASGAMRWQAIIIAQGGRVDLLTTFRIYYVSVFFATFTPGGVFGDVVRVWHANRIGLSLASSISSVILDRLFVVTFLVAIAILTVQFLPPGAQSQFPFGVMSALLFAALLAGLVIPLVIRWLPAGLRSHALVAKIVSLADSMLSVTTRPRSLGWIIFLTAVSQVVLCGVIAVLSLSVDIGVGMVEFMVLMPPVILATVLPISIGGWGMRETAMVFMLSLVGVAPERAFLLSVLMGVVTVVMSLPGGVLWLLFPQAGPQRNAPSP